MLRIGGWSWAADQAGLHMTDRQRAPRPDAAVEGVAWDGPARLSFGRAVAGAARQAPWPWRHDYARLPRPLGVTWPPALIWRPWSPARSGPVRPARPVRPRWPPRSGARQAHQRDRDSPRSICASTPSAAASFGVRAVAYVCRCRRIGIAGHDRVPVVLGDEHVRRSTWSPPPGGVSCPRAPSPAPAGLSRPGAHQPRARPRGPMR